MKNLKGENLTFRQTPDDKNVEILSETASF